MEDFYQRLVDHVWNNEWVSPDSELKCAECRASFHHGRHETDCEVGILCDEIRRLKLKHRP